MTTQEFVQEPTQEAPAADSPLDSAMDTLEAGLESELGPTEDTPEPTKVETAAAPPPDEKQSTETPSGEEKPAEPAAVAMPKSWGAPDEAALWAQLPPAAQAAIVTHEQAAEQRIAVANDHIAVSEGISRVISPYERIFKDHNINPFHHIGNLLHAHATLSFGTPEQKQQIVRDILQQTGLDPLKLASPNTPAYDANQQALMAEVAGLRRTFGAVVNQISSDNVTKLEKEIEAFAGDKNNLYFEELLPDMIASMQQNPNQTLKDCYNSCVWRNPITQAKETDRLANLRMEKKAAEAAEKVAKARKASAADVVSSVGKLARGRGADDWEADLPNMLADVRARNG